MIFNTYPRLESFADATCLALDVVIPERKTAGVGRFASCYAVPYMALAGVDAKYDTDSAASRMYDMRNRQGELYNSVTGEKIKY